MCVTIGANSSHHLLLLKRSMFAANNDLNLSVKYKVKSVYLYFQINHPCHVRLYVDCKRD